MKFDFRIDSEINSGQDILTVYLSEYGVDYMSKYPNQKILSCAIDITGKDAGFFPDSYRFTEAAVNQLLMSWQTLSQEQLSIIDQASDQLTAILQKEQTK